MAAAGKEPCGSCFATGVEAEMTTATGTVRGGSERDGGRGRWLSSKSDITHTHTHAGFSLVGVLSVK